MALSRRGGGGQRLSASIWPGFVDALTVLLLILMFVLTIFMVVQFVLRETITTKDNELDALTSQVAGLADALGLEQGRAADLEATVEGLSANLTAAAAAADQQAAMIAALNADLSGERAALAAAETRITSFEAQVAALISDRDRALGDAAALGAARDQLLSETDALNLALAAARDEVDAGAEAARLAAARREAIEAMLADLRVSSAAAAAALEARLTDAEAARLADAAAAAANEARLTDAEAARLADAAAAEALRARLRSSETELTSMTLALEAQRQRAEDTLTLLAAADAAQASLDAELAAAGAQRQSEAERQAALLAAATNALTEEQAVSVEAARRVTLLNQQIAALRGQLGALQSTIDAGADEDAAAQVQIEALGSQLNTALARVAAEQRRRAELEAAERRRLEEEAKQLSRYRSDFFAKLSEVLAGREGVRVVGDRFVFSSEVLFEPGSAVLAAEGRAQIAGVVATLSEVAGAIPPEIDWIIRVDGHTDNLPLSGFGAFADNWELSQARALSVVRYMQDELGFAPQRMAATGFGEYHPVVVGDTPGARAANRRIELKLTER